MNRIRHSVLSLFRQRLYQIIAGYEDANDGIGYATIPLFRFWLINHRVRLSDRSPRSAAGRTLPRLATSYIYRMLCWIGL
jgi:hypothetical protein